MKTAMDASAPHPGISHEVLVDPGWLRDHLSDPLVRVIEVDVSPAAYDAWHVDGAVLWNIYADLKDADYRLAGTAALERLVERSGIGADSTVTCASANCSRFIPCAPAARTRRRAES